MGESVKTMNNKDTNMKNYQNFYSISNRHVFQLSHHFNVLILTFLLVHSVITTVSAGQPCSDMLYYSGELSTRVYSCTDICGSFQDVGIEYNQSVTLNGLCFCRNNSVAYNNSNSGNLQCVSVDVQFVPHIITTGFVTNKPTRVVVVGLQEFQYIVYDFGDGNTYTTNERMVEHTYISPGYFPFKIGIKKNNSSIITISRLVFIESNEFLITFQGPLLAEKPSDLQNISLEIGGGLNMELKITQQLITADGIVDFHKTEYVFTDVLVLVYGYSLKKEEMNPFEPDEKSLLVPPVIFKVSGSLTSLKFFANKVGMLTVYIIQPECKCCPSCNESVSLMGNENKSSEIRSNSRSKFNITQVIMIGVNETGLQSHCFQTNDVKVNKGDQIAFPAFRSTASKPARLAYGKGVAMITSLSGSLVLGAEVGPFSEDTAYIPYFQASVSKVYTYNLDGVTFNRGNVTVMVEQMNSNSSVGQRNLTSFTIMVKPNVKQLNSVMINETMYIGRNKLYFLFVKVINGSGLNVDVDFLVSQNASSTVSAGNLLIFPYLYPQCGEFNITVTAKNVMAAMSKVMKVTVLCKISGLEIKSSPQMNNEQLVKVSFEEKLHLQITSNGSLVSFNVSWGDGVVDFFNHSNNYPSLEFTFQLSHRYVVRQKYVLTVTAWNHVSNQTMDINIQVQNCSEPPRIVFDYGTKDNPSIFGIGEEIVLYAEYTYPTEQCKNLAKKNVKWGVCKFVNTGAENPRMGVMESGVKCSIRKNTLDIGDYLLILPVEYSGEIFKYEAYIRLIESDLVAQISNGEFQVIPQLKRAKLELAATPYIFEIDGTGSYDPDDPDDNSEITFDWFCQVNYSESIPGTFCNASSLSDGLVWFPLTMQDTPCVLENPDSTVKINSSCILLNTTYVFMLNISKQKKGGVKSAIAKQNVEAAEGESPMVKFACITNCQSKINAMERTVRRYECDSCFGRQLEAKWTVMDKQNQKLLPLKANQQPNLLVDKGELVDGRSYEFSVSLNFVGSSSTTKMKFIISTTSRPYGGSCSVMPSEGMAIGTKFSIFCEGWKSDDEVDRPKVYEFRYDMGGETDDYPLLNPSSLSRRNLMNTLFPPGLKKQDLWITLKIRIINQFGAYAEWSKSKIRVSSPQISPGENGTSRLQGLFEGLLKNKPEDLNDAQAVTAYVTAAGLVLNNLEPNVLPTLEPTPQAGLFGDLDLNKAQREREKADREKERLLKMAFKEDMVNMLGNIDIENIQQFKAVSDSLTTMTDDKGEVSDKSQEKAIDIIFKMKDALKSFARSGKVGADYLKDASKNYVNTISNLFVVEGDKTVVASDKRNENDTQTQTKDEAANKAMKLVDSLDDFTGVLGTTMVAGEPASRLNTPYFAVSIQKNKLSDMANMSVSEESDDDSGEEPSLGFALPNMTSQFEHLGTEVDFSILSVTYKSNVFSWGNGSSKIKSEVPSLAIKTGENPVPVSNTANPIVINIKNKPEDLTTRNVSLFMPGDLMFNKTVLASENCNMLINFDFINDPDNLTQFIAYIQYGEVATADNYDVKLNMSNDYGMIMTVSTEVPFINATEKNETSDLCNRTQADEGRERIVYVRKINNRTILLWNFSKFYWANKCRNLHFTFVYNGPMPERIVINNVYTFDGIEYRGAFNYSVRTICGECTYWNKEKSDWTSDGCALNPDKTTMYTTSCGCNHLTSFGGFFVAPNELKPVSLGSLKQGYVLLVTVLMLLLIYIICLVFARRADKSDLDKTGMCPLIGNNPEHKYMYQVIVDTGSQRSASTKSNVYFNASGDLFESGFRHLTDPERETFQRNNSDVFVMATSSSLGDINYIRIWHDNTGGSWYLRSVKVIDLQTDEEFLFNACRWLAIDKYDGMVDCVIPVCGSDEMSGFNYLFAKQSSQGLSDNHVWFSIYARPTRSSFTRCQRISVAFSLLFCSMVASCMFYGAIPPGSPQDENRIGNFSFKWQQIYVAIVSALITVPINLLLGALFRAIDPLPPDRKHNSEQSGSTFSSAEDTKLINEKPELPTNKESGKRKKSHLPHWCLYLAWILCITVMLLCCILVIWYGMMFGNNKSLEWLASVTVFLIIDIIIIQPILVFLLALVIALLIKKIDDGIKSEGEANAKSLSQNESWLNKFQNSENIFTRMEVPDPPDISKLANMKEIRLKEMKMTGIIREIMFYILYILIVMAIGFNFRDQNAYNQTVDIKELLRLSLREDNTFEDFEIFENIKSYQNIWDWVESLLLTQMYPSKWYDLSEKYKDEPFNDFPGKIFLNDLNAKIVNGVRLRQMRVKHHSCDVESSMHPLITNDCADVYEGNKETRNFNFNWSKPMNSLPTATNALNKPWRYLDSSELDTFGIMAKLHSYSGGGYVVEVFPKFNNRAFLELLKESRWIDRHTRALIVEFATYNAQSNFFNMVIIVFEFPPGGGVVHYHSVETFRLEMYTKETKFFVILTYVLYLIFMIIFCIRESKILYQTGFNYFSEFWNLVEFSIVALSLLAITLFFYLGHLRTVLFGRMPHKVPNVFINFQEASIWYDYMIHAVALICFFVVIKLIKMLRFNQRVSLLSATLNSAWHPLAMFAMMFFVIIGSVVFSTTIIFGHTLYGYRNWFATLSSVFGLLLGKFSYEQFETTNHLLGPSFFFAFNIIVNWIVMNMFITILTDVYADVTEELLGKPNEYEIVDYIVATLKGWIGAKDTSLENVDDQQTEGSASSLNSSQHSRISASEMSLHKFQHSEHEKLFNDFNDSVLIDDVDSNYVKETVDNFVKCINIIYFHQPVITEDTGESNC